MRTVLAVRRAQRYARHPPATGRARGRPVYHVPILCITDNEYNGNGDSTVTARLALDGFVNGLFWRLQQPAHQRPGLPSWSWTG